MRLLCLIEDMGGIGFKSVASVLYGKRLSLRLKGIANIKNALIFKCSFLRIAHSSKLAPFTRALLSGTHFTAESSEAMWIECLVQGNNILMQPGFEPWQELCMAWILYGSKVWCVMKLDHNFRTDGFMVQVMCSIQLMDMKRVNDLTLMLGLHETTDQLAVVTSMH